MRLEMAVAASARPSRFKPASARMVASTRRHRSCATRFDIAAQGHDSRSGRRRLTCAARRSDAVPTIAPAAARRVVALRLTKASRASSRGRQAAMLTVGQQRRHILRRMHREIDLAREQRLLDLLGEQALAAGFGQRPVLDAVAAGADRHDLDRVRHRAHAPPPAARASC